MIKEITIQELHLGHYAVDIVELQDNYQLKNAGHVKSGKIIDNLISHGVSSLLIDTAKTLEPINETSKESSSPLDKRHLFKALYCRTLSPIALSTLSLLRKLPTIRLSQYLKTLMHWLACLTSELKGNIYLNTRYRSPY
ncbi:MAG: DUF3391 domain-containing protein [Thalassotalea sp.]|nr:DUF3391 domain-containing protein [Thalassotalea sp.]